MAQSVENEGLRLEDFIQLARSGTPIKLDIDLDKKTVTQKVHPDESNDMSLAVEMYLRIAQYTHTDMEGHVKSVSKVYVNGWVGENANESHVNKYIANERLKMDYKRLKDAGVIFEEKYF